VLKYYFSLPPSTALDLEIEQHRHGSLRRQSSQLRQVSQPWRLLLSWKSTSDRTTPTLTVEGRHGYAIPHQLIIAPKFNYVEPRYVSYSSSSSQSTNVCVATASHQPHRPESSHFRCRSLSLVGLIYETLLGMPLDFVTTILSLWRDSRYMQ